MYMACVHMPLMCVCMRIPVSLSATIQLSSAVEEECDGLRTCPLLGSCTSEKGGGNRAIQFLCGLKISRVDTHKNERTCSCIYVYVQPAGIPIHACMNTHLFVYGCTCRRWVDVTTSMHVVTSICVWVCR